MDDSDIMAFFAPLVAAVVVVTWFFYVIRYIVLCYKHDSYIKKNFPELSKTESLSVFGDNWDVASVFINIFSSTKAAPDEHVPIMRRKIRYSIYGIFLSMSVLPIGLWILIELFLALRYWLT